MAEQVEASKSNSTLTSTNAPQVPLMEPSATRNTSFVLSPARKFFYEERPLSQLPTPRHVRVRILVTGLCGSDIHYWQHGRIGRYVVESPIVLGHESAGIIEECGPDVKGLKVGDRVAIEPGAGCNTCEVCRSGRYNLCEAMQFAATPPFDGTLSTFYSVPEECCFTLPPHISLRIGALVEPLSIAVHCCSLAGNLQGTSVIVFGAGPIGLLCSTVSQAFGASKVVVVDAADSRLEFAKTFGANETYKMQAESPDANAAKLLAKANLGTGADVVIDATGAEPCISCGISALRRGGVFVQAGLGNPNITFPIGQICDKEAILKGSFRYGPGDYKLAIALLDSKRVRLDSLITHEFTFNEAEQAFKNVAEKTGIKSIIYGPNITKTMAEGTAERQSAMNPQL